MDKILLLPQDIIEVQQSISQALIEYLEAEIKSYEMFVQELNKQNNN